MLWREHEKSELGTDFVRSMLPSSGLHDGLLAYESFDYPEGPLAAQNGGFGWAGTWFDIADDIEAGPSSNRVMSGSLAIEGIMPQGNRAAQTSQKNRIRRSLSTSVGGVFDVAGLVENQDGLRLVGRDGQEVYISFIQKVSALGDNFYGVELYRGDGNPNRVLCVGHGVEGTGFCHTDRRRHERCRIRSGGSSSDGANKFWRQRQRMECWLWQNRCWEVVSDADRQSEKQLQ